MRGWHRNSGNQDQQRGEVEMAGEGKERTSKHSFAKVAAALVALLLLGVMASGALADGDPFSAITAITGTSTSSDDTSSTSSYTTGASTDATTSESTTAVATTTDAATPDASTTTVAATTTDSTTTSGTTTSLSPNLSIRSDKADYHPGETVMLTSDGWQPNESVHLFVNDDEGQVWTYTADVTADELGTFTTQVQLPNTFVATYKVVATGTLSGSTTTSFTDSTMNLSPTSGPVGTTVTVTALNFNKNKSITATWDGAALTLTKSPSPGSCDSDNSGDFTCTFTVPAATAGSHSVVVTDGNGPVDAPFNVSGKQNQATLSITAPSSLTFGASDTAITTSGGSGTGAVTFDAGSSTACSIVGGALHVISATSATATCSITATKAADANFNAITSAPFPITINKASQTISFGALADKTFGDASFTVSATGGGSGNPVTFTATGNCTSGGTNGSTITITGAGSCTVKADQAGSANYNAAAQVSQSFNIAKKAQTITFTPPASAVYGSTLTVTPSSDSGLTVSLATTTATVCSVSPHSGGGFDVTMLTGTGACTLTASQAGNSNYSAAADVSRDVTALKKAQTITFTAPPSPATYDTTFHVGPSSDSGLAVSLAGTAGVCSVTLVSQVNGGGFDVTMLTGTGTCTLTASQAGDGNYSAAAEVAHDVAAAKADATVNLTWASPQTYDGGTHPASATVTGPVAADNPILSPAVSFEYFVGGSAGTAGTGSATAPTDAGAYSVRASFAGNTNYKPDSATKTLTLDKRNTTTSVVADSAASNWGSPVTFTATVVGAGAGAGDPTSGSVTFIEGGTCTAPTTTIGGPVTLDAYGKASVTTTTLSVGGHTVTACYGVSTNFNASSASIAHAVTNTAPIVTLGTNALTANEGDIKMYSFAISDPDPADSWAFATGYPSCGVGNTLVAGSTSINQVAKTGSFQCRFADGLVPALASVVKVKVADFHLAPSSEDTQSVVVSNVAPTVTSFTTANVLSGSMVNGLTGTFTYSFSDPGSIDNSWVASFNWNGFADAVTQTLATQAGSFNARPQFQTGGCGVKATVKVTDKDGDYGTLTSSTVNVGTGAFLPPMTNQPVTDQLKNGQVLPVKVTLKDCSGNPINGLSPTIALKQGDLTDQNDNSTDSIIPTSVSSADTNGVMRPQSDGTYMYNMKVNVTVGQPYTVVITPTIPGYASSLTLRHKIIATK
jgi:hypothetical protein